MKSEGRALRTDMQGLQESIHKLHVTMVKEVGELRVLLRTEVACINTTLKTSATLVMGLFSLIGLGFGVVVSFFFCDVLSLIPYRRTFCAGAGADLRALGTEMESLKSAVLTIQEDMKTERRDLRTELLGLRENHHKLHVKMVKEMGEIRTDVARINATLKTSATLVMGLFSLIGLGVGVARYNDTAALKKELKEKEEALKEKDEALKRSVTKERGGLSVVGTGLSGVIGLDG